MAVAYPTICAECGKLPLYYFDKEEDLHTLRCNTAGCKYFSLKTYYPSGLCGKDMCIQIWNQQQEFRSTMKKLFDMIDDIKNSNIAENEENHEKIDLKYNTLEITFKDGEIDVIHNVMEYKFTNAFLQIYRYGFGNDIYYEVDNIKDVLMYPTKNNHKYTKIEKSDKNE